MNLVLILAGFVLLLIGGETLVKGSVAVARRLGMSPLVIGITLVGFGTSTPELLTSVQAALEGAPGIALGNVVGSNIANILLILGVAATLTPIAVARRTFARDAIVLAAATLLCVLGALTGVFGRLTGLAFLALLAAYLLITYRHERANPTDVAADTESATEAREGAPLRLGLALPLSVLGIAITVVGARLLVTGAIRLASDLGVSEAVIGLTVVAIGTSLPELVTAVVAALRRQADLAYGNVIGSNIFNILGILAITALVQPVTVAAEIVRVDIWVMLAATALAITFALTGWRITRVEGVVFLCGYFGYIAAISLRALAPV